MWLGDSAHKFAPCLATLYAQLVKLYPDTAWQTSPQTGSIGDAAHFAEGSASDHNPWFNNTVRAMDIANVPSGPDCEALFMLTNQMYAAKDARVYPDGYGIFKGRITDWENPGKWKLYEGTDQHYGHFHISCSTNSSGYNSGLGFALTPAPIVKDDDLTKDQNDYLVKIATQSQVNSYAINVIILPALARMDKEAAALYADMLKDNADAAAIVKGTP